MARLILDTSILVNLERRGDTLERLIDDEDDVAVAAITAAELLVGVELARGRKRTRRQEQVDGLLKLVSVESYDLEVAKSHASLLAWVRRQGRPRGAHDLIIAATAAARSRHVVTTDESAFVDLPGVSLRGP
ncbi:MAG TPA: PIN domain-containing protein [Actinomycetota bacterium]|nr:PIN domain-containing protein [Actinomycetota bacterium]